MLRFSCLNKRRHPSMRESSVSTFSCSDHYLWIPYLFSKYWCRQLSINCSQLGGRRIYSTLMERTALTSRSTRSWPSWIPNDIAVRLCRTCDKPLSNVHYIRQEHWCQPKYSLLYSGRNISLPMRSFLPMEHHGSSPPVTGMSIDSGKKPMMIGIALSVSPRSKTVYRPVLKLFQLRRSGNRRKLVASHRLHMGSTYLNTTRLSFHKRNSK